MEAEIVRLLETGKKIEAIKVYRGRTGVGLKEAKDAVEAVAAQQGIVAPSGFGCLGRRPSPDGKSWWPSWHSAARKSSSMFPLPFRPRPEPTLADALAVIKSKQFVDLTHAFEPGIPHWPGFPDEKRETLYWYDGGKGRWARASSPSSSPTSASGARTAIHRRISSRASGPSTRSTPRK